MAQRATAYRPFGAADLVAAIAMQALTSPGRPNLSVLTGEYVHATSLLAL
jgi:hypothetical protein